MAGQAMKSVIATLFVASMTGAALAQTQRTPPSTYATLPTWPSAFATAPISPCYGWSYRRSYRWHGPRSYRWSSYNPTSPCYSGSPYPSYSAIEPLEFPHQRRRAYLPGAANLNESEARRRIEAKGYLEVSGLVQDRRGVWRGRAKLKDGRSVDVILDLEGNIYSEWGPAVIRLESPPLNCCF